MDRLITSGDGPDGSIDAASIEQTARRRILEAQVRDSAGSGDPLPSGDLDRLSAVGGHG